MFDDDFGITALTILGIVFTIILMITGVIFGWFDTWFTNEVDYVNHKIEDKTNYDTRKKVEDTCRSMISSYKSDKSIYDTYKNSDDKEKQSWGEQAKIRANKTAISYNEYILKNSFVFEDSIPEDIKKELNVIE